MISETYFHSQNYIGDHLHVNNFRDEYTSYIEGIAWVRSDGSMDLFFDEFIDDDELNKFLVSTTHDFVEHLGVFIKNVKTDDEAYEAFREWAENILEPFRNEEN